MAYLINNDITSVQDPITEELIDMIIAQQKINRHFYFNSILPELINNKTTPRFYWFTKLFKCNTRKNVHVLADEVGYLRMRIQCSMGRDRWDMCEDPITCMRQLNINPNKFDIPELYKKVQEEYRKNKS
jgi:hypothetical protein